MYKRLRKTTILMLIPILVCMLSVSVFAASDSFYADASYDGGNQYIEADANISRYATGGIINSIEYGNYLYVSCGYGYYPSGGQNLRTDTMTDASYRYYANVAFSDSSIHAMYNATYTFEAYVETSYGTQYFRPNVVTLVY